MYTSSVDDSFWDFRLTLTSPFLTKRVTINAHTDLDEPRDTSATLSKYNLPGVEYTSTRKLQVDAPYVGIIDCSSKSSASLVESMIVQGYSAEQAIDTQKAIRAYGLNALNANGITTLSTNAYEA